MNDLEKAYIAGFLDGDGSIMAQLIYRKDYKLGFQIRTSIVFYQKTCHQDFLSQLRERLEIGYIRKRPDGMSEYTIVGLKEVGIVLKLLVPFLRLKKDLALVVLEIIKSHPPQRKMTPEQLIALSKMVDATAKITYSKKRSVTSARVMDFLEKNIVYPRRDLRLGSPQFRIWQS